MNFVNTNHAGEKIFLIKNFNFVRISYKSNDL